MPLFQPPRPSVRSPRLTDGSRTLSHCPVSPRRPHREPAPTSRGGAEERAAGGGAVVPGRQLHAVAEDHPAGGRDGPTWGLAAAAAPRHGLSRAAPAAGAWPFGRPGPSRFALSRPPLAPSASEPRRPLGFVVAAAPRPHQPPRGCRYVRSSAAQVRGSRSIAPARGCGRRLASARPFRSRVPPATLAATGCGRGPGVCGGQRLAGRGRCSGLCGDPGSPGSGEGLDSTGGLGAGWAPQPFLFRALVPPMRKCGVIGHSLPHRL